MLKLRFASRPSTAWVFWSTGFRIRLLYVNVKAEGRAILKPQIQRDQHCLINLLASQQEFIPSYLSIDPSTCLSTKTARSVYAILPVSVKGVLGFPGILPPPRRQESCAPGNARILPWLVLSNFCYRKALALGDYRLWIGLGLGFRV